MPFFRTTPDRNQPNPRKDLARERGVMYLKHARQYQQRGDYRNALTTAQEGARLAAGPFYLAVQETLTDLIQELKQQLTEDIRPASRDFKPVEFAHLTFGK